MRKALWVNVPVAILFLAICTVSSVSDRPVNKKKSYSLAVDKRDYIDRSAGQKQGMAVVETWRLVKVRLYKTFKCMQFFSI